MKIQFDIKQDQAEKIYNSLCKASERVIHDMDFPKTTIRFGKNVRCERIEVPGQNQPVYMCRLNVAMD